ncbi:hypothetical protein [Lacibacter sp. H407]|uniref:hypothetical protein n=1 Tax=Lacibacter sp. H407 TaxID=3133423 RepID=UPI0030C1C011
MQRVLFVICFFLNALVVNAQSAAINTDGSNADASAILDVKSTNKGFLLPRMTTAQRTAIVLPAKGLKVFDTDTNSFWFYNGTAWVEIGIGKNQWVPSGNNIYNSNSGNVGIGTNTPISKLSVVHDGTGLLVKSTAGYSNIDIDAANNEPRVRWFRNGVLKWDLHSTNLFTLNASFGLREEGFGYRLLIHGGTGNVSIGRDNANAKLHVGGSGLFEDAITIGSNTHSASHSLNVYGSYGILSKSTSGFSIIDIDAFNGDAALRFSDNGNLRWNIRNRSSDDGLEFVEFGGGSRMLIEKNTGIVKITNQLTVDAGKGIVRSSNSNQLMMHYVSGEVGIPDAPSGYFADATFGYPDIFTGTPRVSVANIVNGTGTFHRWVLTVHSVDTTAKTFKVRFYNSSSTASTFSGTYYFLVVGAAND